MNPDDLSQQHTNLCQRIAAGKERMALCSGILDEVAMDAAIKTAALSIAQNLRFDDCLPALSRAVVIDAMRPKLLAALKAELIDAPEADLVAFKAANAVELKAHCGIT